MTTEDHRALWPGVRRMLGVSIVVALLMLVNLTWAQDEFTVKVGAVGLIFLWCVVWVLMLRRETSFGQWGVVMGVLGSVFRLEPERYGGERDVVLIGLLAGLAVWIVEIWAFSKAEVVAASEEEP